MGRAFHIDPDAEFQELGHHVPITRFQNNGLEGLTNPALEVPQEPVALPASFQPAYLACPFLRLEYDLLDPRAIVQRRLPKHSRHDLPLHRQVSVATQRGRGLAVGLHTQSSVWTRLQAHGGTLHPAQHLVSVEHFVLDLLQICQIWRVLGPEDRGHPAAPAELRHCHVGQHHHFTHHEAGRRIARLASHHDSAVLRYGELEIGLLDGHGPVEQTPGKEAFRHVAKQFAGRVHPVGAVFQDGVHLVIGQPFHRPNHGGHHLGLPDGSVGVHREHHAECEPGFLLYQATQIAGQPAGQHGKFRIREVQAGHAV